MTNDTAIALLEGQMEIYRDVPDNMDWSGLRHGIAEALEMGIELLRDGITQKSFDTPRAPEYEYLCPRCGDYARISLANGDEIKCRFCPHCGQAIDWDSEDEQKGNGK